METLYYKVNISIEDGDLVAINKDNNKATFSFKNAENFIQGKILVYQLMEKDYMLLL